MRGDDFEGHIEFDHADYARQADAVALIAYFDGFRYTLTWLENGNPRSSINWGSNRSSYPSLMVLAQRMKADGHHSFRVYRDGKLLYEADTNAC